MKKCTIEKMEGKNEKMTDNVKNKKQNETSYRNPSKKKKHERDAGGTSAGATVRQSLSKTTHYKKNNDLTKVEEQDDHIKSQPLTLKP